MAKGMTEDAVRDLAREALGLVDIRPVVLLGGGPYIKRYSVLL